jgi:toxin FitB
MIVLDTDVLSEPMRLRPDARVLAWLTGLEEESAVTSVTAVEATLGTFAGSVLAYDDAAARRCAQLHEVRRAAGRPLSVEDGMIAAICLVAGATLATRDASRFTGLGLALVDPWR